MSDSNRFAGKLLTGAASGITGKIAHIALAPISIGIASRVLGEGDFGSYASLVSVASIIAIGSSFQARGLLSREVSPDLEKEVWSTAVWVSIFLVGCTASLVVVLALIMSAGIMPTIGVGIIVSIAPLSSVSRGLLLQHGRARRFAVAETLVPVSTLTMFAILGLTTRAHYAWFVIATGLATSSSTLVALGSSGRRLLFSSVKSWPSGRPLRSGLLLAAPLGAMLVIQRADVTLVALLGPAGSAGDYLVTLQVFEAPLALIGSALVFLVPTLRDLKGTGRTQFVIRLLLAVSLVNAILTAGIAFFAADISSLVLGRGSSVTTANVFIASAAVLASGYTVLSALAVATSADNMAARAAIGGAVLNVALNFVLIPLHGTTGAAVATTLTYLSLFVVLLWLLMRGAVPIRSIVGCAGTTIALASFAAFAAFSRIG